MKCLLSKLIEYDTIIFDMDGCLYDEFEFISIRYNQIVKSLVAPSQQSSILNEMLSSWLNFGSADNTLFSRIENKYTSFTENEFEKRALEIFRSYPFNLELSKRASFILSKLNALEKVLMMVTDGNYRLQRAKFDSLGLSQYFALDKVVFTGEFGGGYYKPNPFAFAILEKKSQGDILYVGDRELDEYFAKNAGLDFIYVRNMQYG